MNIIHDWPSLYSTLAPSPLLVTSGHQDWRAAQTCSLQDPLPTADIWWLVTNGGLVGGTHHIGMLYCYRPQM